MIFFFGRVKCVSCKDIIEYISLIGFFLLDVFCFILFYFVKYRVNMFFDRLFVCLYRKFLYFVLKNYIYFCFIVKIGSCLYDF